MVSGLYAKKKKKTFKHLQQFVNTFKKDNFIGDFNDFLSSYIKCLFFVSINIYFWF